MPKISHGIATGVALLLSFGAAHAQDSLVWCRQGGFTSRVPVSVCEGAFAHRQPSRAERTREAGRRQAVEDCVSELASEGYVQRYSGQLYQLCATGQVHPMRQY